MRHVFILGGLLCATVSQLGCAANTNARLEAADRQIRARDVQNANLNRQLEYLGDLLTVRGEQLRARDGQLRDALANAPTAEAQLAKLNELIAANAKMAERLAAAEATLSKIRTADEGTSSNGLAPEVALAATELDAQLEHEIFARPLEDNHEDMPKLHVSAAARTAAYERLIRQVQFLVDTGRVHAVPLKGGRVHFRLPPQLESSDPWVAEAAD